jgi:hypothetical protein
MSKKHMFIIIGWQNFNILWMCGALVKDLVFQFAGEGVKSF